MTNQEYILNEIKIRDDQIWVELKYPGLEGQPKFIRIGLEDVRAADDIRVCYDFDRDGWVIQQSTDCEEEQLNWVEVAFVKAWAFAK